MRPRSIVSFERVVLLMIVIGLADAVLNWEILNAELARQGIGEGVAGAAYGVSVVISLLLLWLIARRRSNVARWIYVVLCVASLAVALPAIGALSRLPMSALLIEAAQWLLAILSVFLLFARDARAWFARSGDAPAA